jgi:rubredoxin
VSSGTDIDIGVHRLIDALLYEKDVCIICGYVYDPAEGDPESGIAPGTAFEDIPADWTCPACGVGKEHFEKWNG